MYMCTVNLSHDSNCSFTCTGSMYRMTADSMNSFTMIRAVFNDVSHKITLLLDFVTGLSVSCTLVEVMKAMEKWKDPFPKKFIVLTVVWGIYDCAIAIEKWLKDAQEENWLEDVVVCEQLL